jgi:hypothetical protein
MRFHVEDYRSRGGAAFIYVTPWLLVLYWKPWRWRVLVVPR